MGDAIHYPDHFIDRLHTIWGEGFLSPGGPQEVRDIVQGVDLAGRSVLDIGCGTGGPALLLAGETGLARLVAIDVEAPVLERARAQASESGLADRVAFQQIEPGPLPFADSSFDIVFSKDALIHIPDKAGLYRDVLRVLRPGGAFLASDWLGGENTAASPEWQRYQRLGHLDFTMVTAAQVEEEMRAAGFETVSTRDRNSWYAEVCRQELKRIEGPLRDELIGIAGAEIYLHWLEVRRALADSVAAGALRPTHLRGFKPAV